VGVSVLVIALLAYMRSSNAEQPGSTDPEHTQDGITNPSLPQQNGVLGLELAAMGRGAAESGSNHPHAGQMSSEYADADAAEYGTMETEMHPEVGSAGANGTQSLLTVGDDSTYGIVDSVRCSTV
jgi:hypothetical protein